MFHTTHTLNNVCCVFNEQETTRVSHNTHLKQCVVYFMNKRRLMFHTTHTLNNVCCVFHEQETTHVSHNTHLKQCVLCI